MLLLFTFKFLKAGYSEAVGIQDLEWLIEVVLALLRRFIACFVLGRLLDCDLIVVGLRNMAHGGSLQDLMFGLDHLR